MGKLLQALMDGSHQMAEKMFMPEVYAYHWVRRKLGLEEMPQVIEDLNKLPNNEWRFVDYYAASCPHCVNLIPDFDKAMQTWAAEHGQEAVHVSFVKKQCLDDKWQPGPDLDECQAAQVHAFPTLKMYGPNGQVVDYNMPSRSFDDMMKFAAKTSGLAPPEAEGADHAAAAAAEPPTEEQDGLNPADFQNLAHMAPEKDSMIEYHAASCPHCVKLKPTWDTAVNEFQAKNEDVPWIQKECLNGDWKPGKDFKECIANDIGSFPTIRYETKGGVYHEFMGKRTAEDLEKFAEAEIKYFQEHPDQAVKAVEPALAENAAAPEDVPAPEAAQVAEDPTPAPAVDEHQPAPIPENLQVFEKKADLIEAQGGDFVNKEEGPWTHDDLPRGTLVKKDAYSHDDDQRLGDGEEMEVDDDEFAADERLYDMDDEKVMDEGGLNVAQAGMVPNHENHDAVDGQAEQQHEAPAPQIDAQQERVDHDAHRSLGGMSKEDKEALEKLLNEKHSEEDSAYDKFERDDAFVNGNEPGKPFELGHDTTGKARKEREVLDELETELFGDANKDLLKADDIVGAASGDVVKTASLGFAGLVGAGLIAADRNGAFGSERRRKIDNFF